MSTESIIAVAAIVAFIVTRFARSRITRDALPALALAVGVLTGALLKSVLSWPPTLASAGEGAALGLAGGTAAIAGRDAVKPLLYRVLPGPGGDWVISLIFGPERGKPGPQNRARSLTTGVLLVLLVASASGCAQLSQLAAGLAAVTSAQTHQQRAAAVGSAVDTAEAAANAWLARHPVPGVAQSMPALLLGARTALDAYRAATAETEAERWRVLLDAYERLRKHEADAGILDATPPPGGAETEAPEPKPVRLPTVVELESI